MISNTINTLDSNSKNMIPNLSPGQCVITGNLFELPMIVQVNKLSKELSPNSDNADIINLWKKINYTTTERQYDCINVSRCDPIYKCENAFNCADCNNSKNIVFCDGCIKCENMLASQRTTNSGFCLRVDDSSTCSNSYNVICSSNISNSIFIQDCSNLHECIFCSHISNQKTQQNDAVICPWSSELVLTSLL